MDTDLNSAISAFLANCEDHQLFRLTRFYMERLQQAIEEGVEGVSFMLMAEDHFTGREYHGVTELAEKGNRSGASRLLLDLVMEKGSGARRVMWESFVKLHHHLPKLSRILNEIRERGDGQFAYMDTERGLSEVPRHLIDVRQKHMETLRAQTETLRVNTILMREKVKVFQLVDRYAELTVISTVRDRTLVEHELLARGRDHEEWRQKHLRGELEKIRTDQIFKKSFVQRLKNSAFGNKSGVSAAVVGVSGIGKTTMLQKIVYDWATGKIYQQFQFVFSFQFRDLNSINCRINLKELVLDQYPYFGNILREVWKNPEGLLFIFDGLDEFKHGIDFADSRRDTEPKHQCPDPEWWCEVSDIVYSLIQGKLLPGCSVLVTTRPTALRLLEKADISVWTEILGFVGEERKEYFIRYFEDQTVAAAVFKHVEENEILYTMSYKPSYCWILALALGPFFTQRVRDPQRIPKTNTQLYSYYIYNILKNHGREIENPRDVLLRVGQMAFRGVSERKIVFTDGDLIKNDLQPSQFLSGFLMELLERKDSARSVEYTFPHLTIQEFVAAVAQFLNPHPGDILKFHTEVHSTTDGRFELFLRFVAGLSSPMTARGLENLGSTKLGDSEVKLLSAILGNPRCKIQKLGPCSYPCGSGGWSYVYVQGGPGEDRGGTCAGKESEEEVQTHEEVGPETAELTPICPEVEREAWGNAQSDGVMEAESNAPSVNPAPVCSSGLKRRRECSPKRAGNLDVGESKKGVGIRVEGVSNPESTSPVVGDLVVQETISSPVCTTKTDLEPSAQDSAGSATLEHAEAGEVPASHPQTEGEEEVECCVRNDRRQLKSFLDDLVRDIRVESSLAPSGNGGSQGRDGSSRARKAKNILGFLRDSAAEGTTALSGKGTGADT
ncbi:NACHT, LRR and PYD domains-containing protein 3-like [Hemitrygon akajei]|uniref:NACHT, LRR and PYD domains-containing protein 3-like n=1 Tax=Hemitrygon akajei TaxID=2704970 RepID=UPI003BF9D717